MMTDFEAFLLVKMRAKSLVNQVLRNESLTEEQVMAKAQNAADLWQLNNVGYHADVYSQAIGQPVSERLLTEAETSREFSRSVQRKYRLELWPKVIFLVNKHPRGYAWGERFSLETGDVPGFDLSRVKPWEWTADAIESAASRVEILEFWNYERDVEVSFREGTAETTYVARFDFDLLQEWCPTSR